VIRVEGPGVGPAQFVLASSSPRRRQLLAGAGLRFAVVEPATDEARRAGEAPVPYARRAALEKLRAGMALARADLAGAGTLPVLAADTIVALGEEVLHKPVSVEAGRATLRALSGRVHLVHTAVAVGLPSSDNPSASVRSAVVTSGVAFHELDGAWIERYLATGEGLDRAGGYAIQGIGAELVAAIEGSYTNVVGLPLEESLGLLRQLGVTAADHGS
jgi:septum formation protein